MAIYSVLYDACVLYPAPLRDLLLGVAMVDLFRARLTETILDECFRSLAKNRHALLPDLFTRTREQMNAHVLDALITGHETLIHSLTGHISKRPIPPPNFAGRGYRTLTAQMFAWR